MSENKDKTIIIRVSEDLKNNIKQSAGALGLTVSSYMIYLYNKFGKNEN